MAGPIGVGIVGANPERGWAVRAHIPAIAASSDLALTAVATTRKDSADAARTRFGALHAFTDPGALAAHPDVDLVVVTVKVSTHVDLVTAALDAGKHVYCEWPLAPTAAEAAALAASARTAAVHAAVGLQARFSPAACRAHAMITEGVLGAIRSATVYSARSKGNTHDVPAWSAYTYDRHGGAGLVEVLGGHALDLVQHLLGPIRRLTARTAILTPEHRIAETGEPIDVTAPDHFLATAELNDGAVVSLHLNDGAAAVPRTDITIAGTEGNLRLVSVPDADPWAAQLQISPFNLYEARRNSPEWIPVEVPTDHASALPIQAANVARLYQRLTTDLRQGSRTTPDFSTAHNVHQLIERSMTTREDCLSEDSDTSEYQK